LQKVKRCGKKREDGNRLTSGMMKLTAIASQRRKRSRLEKPLGKTLPKFLGSSTMPPPEEMSLGNEGWQGRERVPRKEVFIGYNEQGYF